MATGSFMDLVDADAVIYPFRFYRSALFDVIAAGRIGGLTRLPGGGVTFQIAGLEGRSYIIQASTNLVNWVNLSTNLATGGTINFTDPNPAHPPTRFYRLQSGP